MTVIDTERYMLTCMRYIELNPVHAGMVAHPADDPSSSYHRNGHGARDELVAEHDLYRRLGRTVADCCAAYQPLFRAQIGHADLEGIRQATNKGWALGNDRFSEKIEVLSRRPAAPRRPGRHRPTSQPEYFESAPNSDPILHDPNAPSGGCRGGRDGSDGAVLVEAVVRLPSPPLALGATL